MKQNHNISDPTYDNTSQLYDYVYAFFYGFVRSINYTYDEKTIKIAELSSFTEYTYDTFSNMSNKYDYICGSMMLGGNKKYSLASHGVFFNHTMTEQGISFDYFGARYYASDLSVWLSVDPLASKYPSMSPYMYVAGNPVKLIDPDGRDIVPGNDKASSLIRKSIRRVFGNDKIADEIFVYKKNGNITTRKEMSGLSFRKFKRKLKKAARKHKGRRGKKKYTKKELKDAYSIYQKADSEKEIIITAVSSYSLIEGDKYYNSTNSNEHSNYSVKGSEAINLVNEFIKIEEHSEVLLDIPIEMGGGSTNRDIEIVNNKTAYLKNEIPKGTRVYPSGNVIIDITNSTPRKEVSIMKEVLTK